MNRLAEGAPGVKEEASEANTKPSFRLSDAWRAPFHDLPIRDEIIYQCLPLGREMAVLEVGPGSGFTAFRLARHVREIVSLDAAPHNIARLQMTLKGVANLRLVCGDIAQPDIARITGGPFDAAFALDVLQYVPQPHLLFRRLAEVLRSGGRLLVLWPNYPPERTGGVAYVATRNVLDAMLRDAGFRGWEVYTLELRRFPALLFNAFHDRPLRFLRSLRNRTGDARPQVYDQTWTLRSQQRLEPLKVPLNLAWAVLMAAMRLRGTCFERTPLHGENIDGNLLLLARR